MTTLPTPDTDSDHELKHAYTACIYRIKAQPTAASQKPCILCGGTHKFDECKILQNTESLRGHYIRFCQQIHREASARTSTFPGTDALMTGLASPTGTSHHVNFLDANPTPAADTSHDTYHEHYGQYHTRDSDSESDQDF